LRHPKSICHAMPRLKRQSALASIEYQITIFGLTDPPPAINAANSFPGTIGHVPVAVL
jgi:hypothetical protein